MKSYVIIIELIANLLLIGFFQIKLAIHALDKTVSTKLISSK